MQHHQTHGRVLQAPLASTCWIRRRHVRAIRITYAGHGRTTRSRPRHANSILRRLLALIISFVLHILLGSYSLGFIAGVGGSTQRLGSIDRWLVICICMKGMRKLGAPDMRSTTGYHGLSKGVLLVLIFHPLLLADWFLDTSLSLSFLSLSASIPGIAILFLFLSSIYIKL